MLSLTIARSALLDALSSAAKVVEKRNTIRILSNVLLVAEGGMLTITSTDLDIWIVTRVPAEIAAEGGITLPGGAIHDIARKLPSTAQVTIEDTGEGRAGVRSGRSRFTLPTLPADDFPPVKALESALATEIRLPAKTLKSSLSRTAFAISTEETRYYLNGTYLAAVETDAGPALRAVATDGHRLARIDTADAQGLDLEMPGVIVPRKAVHEMKRLAEEAGDAAVTLTVTRALIEMQVGDTRLVSKLIDGTFPDYARVIPASGDKRLLVQTDALKIALDRVSTLATERARRVKLSLNDARLTVTAMDTGDGEAVDDMDAEYEGPLFDVGANGKYLADILGEIGSDTTLFEIGDPGSPIRILPREGADALFILMPMRV